MLVLDKVVSGKMVICDVQLSTQFNVFKSVDFLAADLDNF